MDIIDTHLHYYSDHPKFDPDILFRNDTLKQAWILSTNGVVEGQATNRQVLDLAKQYAGRIVPFAYLDLEGAPEQIRDYKAQGFAGLKVVFSKRPYDSPEYFPFWEEAQQAGLPVVVHVGGSYYNTSRLTRGAECSFSKNMMPMTMDVPLKLFPKILFVLAHFGGCKHTIDTGTYLVRGHSRVRGHAPVYVDLSGGNLLRWDTLKRIKEAIEDIGPDAVLYGNDLNYDLAVQCAGFWNVLLRQSWFRETDWADKILHKNAQLILEQTGWSADNLK